MERLDILEWSRRRAEAALAASLQRAANFIPLPIVITTGQGKVLKGTLLGLVVTFPAKPTFEQLDILPPTLVKVIDYHERILLAQDDLNVKEREWVMDVRNWIPVNPGGVVVTMPSFFGADP